MLSQTRAAGTPPPAVVLKSKRKFLRTVQQDSEELTPVQEHLIQRSLTALASKLPEEVFTGLKTKSRVSVTGSACAEATRAEGGTYEALLVLVTSREDMIPVRDFDTGKVLTYKSASLFESAGEALFHCCLDEVLRTTPEELRKVQLTTVKEPGKARTVTKGPAALKVVLDTVSKICSWPLKKLESSASGMGKSHHGWNLFCDLFDEQNFKKTLPRSRRGGGRIRRPPRADVRMGRSVLLKYRLPRSDRPYKPYGSRTHRRILDAPMRYPPSSTGDRARGLF
jgi:hypothetical protein